MAFPTVPTTGANTLLQSTTTTASTTHTFPNLTTLAPQAGDLIIAICVMYTGGTNNAEFSSWGASLTETRDDATTTANDLALGVAHKIASGSESGTFTVTSATAARSVNFLMRIPAATWHGSTIPEVLASVRASAAVADPGSFDPSNWAAEDTLWISVYGHSETSTTGSPPTIDTPPANYTGQLIVARNADAVGHITAAVAFRQVNATSQDVGAWTVSNPTRGNGLASVVGIRPHPPITVDITHAAETDSVQALTFVQGTDSIGGPALETDFANEIIPLQPLPALEADAAQPLDYELAAGGTHYDITHAAETDSAQPVTYAQASDYDITQAEETDSAGALRAPRIATATETDAAQAVSFTKTIYKTAGEAAETDTAQPLTISQASDYDIVHAAETDTAGALRAPRIATAAETDTAEPVSYSQAGAYDIVHAAETDSAQTLDADKLVTIVRANETDFANEIVPFQVFPATETDSAQPLSYEISGAQHVNISPAAETDSAQAVDVDKLVTLPTSEATPPLPYNTVHIGDTATAMALDYELAGGFFDIVHAAETDSAQALTFTKPIVKTLTTAGETDTAQPVTYSQAGSYDILPAAETDSARALTRTYTITRAAETDTAQPVTYSGPQIKTLVPVEETDAAAALVVTKPIYKTITLVTETDSAVALTKAKGVTLTPATETDTLFALDIDKRVTLTLVAETDTAVAFGIGGAFPFTNTGETDAALSLSYGILPPTGVILNTRTGRFTHVKPGRISRPKQGALV